MVYHSKERRNRIPVEFEKVMLMNLVMNQLQCSMILKMPSERKSMGLSEKIILKMMM